VINRRTDLRYQKEPVDLISLTSLQRELLANAAGLVKRGGILVYATCSIEPEENFNNIRWFLKEHSNFVGDDISQFLPQDFSTGDGETWKGPLCKTESEMTQLYMLQLLPPRHHVSGFFVSRLKRCD
jgi:16S rRNA (cytosine967-C5)-methyltransferase